MQSPVTPAEFNRLKDQWWEHAKATLQERSADPLLARIALATLDAEQRLQVPIRNQMTMEYALEQAEKTRNFVRRDNASKGGRAKKTDALNELIQQFVQNDPSISEKELLRKLATKADGGPVVDIDDKNIWLAPENGPQEAFKISGLKDRLSRLKKNSR